MPLAWKEAHIAVIYKNGKDPKCVNSYRPISLLNTLGKLLERVIKSRLDNWISQNNILSESQSGFRKGRSTRDHLFRLIQTCQEGFNKNMATGAIFVDIEKAFDRVWLNGLLFKLHKLELPHYLGCWLKSYLSNRIFKVKIQNELSTSKSIYAGVPQGSILGPTLFNLFFNDISEYFSNNRLYNLALFADDLATWTTSPYVKIIEKNLQAASNWIFSWSLKWRTTISISKTVTILFSNGGKKQNLRVFYDENLIEYDSNPKFLGVTLDQGLRFNKHTETIALRARKRLNILASMKGKKWGLSTNLLLTTYKVLVRSLFDYSALINLILAPSLLTKLTQVQNKAMRLATYWPPGVTTNKMLLDTDLTSLKDRSTQMTIKFLNKSLDDNKMISSLLDKYLECPEVCEGAITKKNKKIFKTLLGIILSQPPELLNQKFI